MADLYVVWFATTTQTTNKFTTKRFNLLFSLNERWTVSNGVRFFRLIGGLTHTRPVVRIHIKCLVGAGALVPIIFIYTQRSSPYRISKGFKEIFTLHLFSSCLLTLSYSLFSLDQTSPWCCLVSIVQLFSFFFLFPLAAPKVFYIGGRAETDPRWYDRPKMQQTCPQRKSEGHERKGSPLLLAGRC